MNIYEKLSAIQVTLKAPKNQRNIFGKYNYRSLEDIMEGLKPLLLAHSCAVIISDELMLIGDRYYIKATASLVNSEDNERVSCSAFAREASNQSGMHDAQLTGSTSSYARKYAVNGLFAIDDIKDPDTMDNTELKSESTQKITTAMLEKALLATGSTVDVLIDTYNKKTGKDIKELKFMSQEFKLHYYERMTKEK